MTFLRIPSSHSNLLLSYGFFMVLFFFSFTLFNRFLYIQLFIQRVYITYVCFMAFVFIYMMNQKKTTEESDGKREWERNRRSHEYMLENPIKCRLYHVLMNFRRLTKGVNNSIHKNVFRMKWISAEIIGGKKLTVKQFAMNINSYATRTDQTSELISRQIFSMNATYERTREWEIWWSKSVDSAFSLSFVSFPSSIAKNSTFYSSDNKLPLDAHMYSFKYIQLYVGIHCVCAETTHHTHMCTFSL